LGEWRLLALNSNCGRVGGCVRGSAQYEWLEEELQKRGLCSLAFFHHPMISSGPHGGHRELFDFFELLDERSVELTLSGHEHFYERFSPISGQRIDDEAGVQPFVVGTGGKRFRKA